MDYAALLQKQKQLTLDAQGRKGKKATNKHGRAFLEMLFANKVGTHARLALHATLLLPHANTDPNRQNPAQRAAGSAPALSATPTQPLPPRSPNFDQS